MLDEIGMQNFARNIHEQFIQPEIGRRREVGALSEDFRIRELCASQKGVFPALSRTQVTKQHHCLSGSIFGLQDISDCG